MLRSEKGLRIFPLLLYALFAVLLPLNAWSDIYSFKDDQGVIHFTNVPTDQRYKVFLSEKGSLSCPSGDLKQYDSLISEVCEKYHVDTALIKAVIKAESNFDPYATSWKGAQGLMQLMPETAYDLKVNDVYHPRDNLDGGVRYLRYLLDRFDNNLSLALAAYNAGENAVIRYNFKIPPYDETKRYVSRVLQYFRTYQRR